MNSDALPESRAFHDVTTLHSAGMPSGVYKEIQLVVTNRVCFLCMCTCCVAHPISGFYQNRLLPGRIYFSCVCAERGPDTPAASALLAYLCLGGTGRNVMSWLDAFTAAWLGGCCLRLMQNCWPALLGVSYACVPLVVSDCLCMHA